MNKLQNVFFVVGFVCFAITNVARSQDSEAYLAQRLPNNVSLFATLDQPSTQLNRFLQGIGLPEASIREMVELLLYTNPTDGTVRVRDSGNAEANTSDFGVLLNAKSIHFILTESREKIGDWVILIDRGDSDSIVSVDTCRLWIRVISQAWNHNKLTRQFVIPPDFEEALGRWDMTVHVEAKKRWICIGASKESCEVFLQAVDSEVPVDKSLAKDRTFQSYRVSGFYNASFSSYFSVRDSKRLLVSLAMANESNWRQLGYDEIPWMGTWMRVVDSRDNFRIDRKTVQAATIPLSGKHQFWAFYHPLETFPPLPEGVQSVTGKHVDLEGWHKTAKRIYPDLYGKGVYEEYENHPLLAWQTGISRPKLGNVKFEFVVQRDKEQRPEGVVLYDTTADSDAQTIMGYLELYGVAMNERAKRVFEISDYKRTEVEGNAAWWTEYVRMNPRSMGAAAGLGSSDSDIAPEGEENDKGESQIDSAAGCVLIDGWVIQGNRLAIDRLVEWDSPARLVETGVKDCEEMIRDCASHFEFGTFYGFQLQQESQLDVFATKLQKLLYRALPVGWAVRIGVFEEAKMNPEIVDSFSRPQKLRFLLESAIDNIRSLNPKRIQIDAFDGGLTKSLTGESWIFEKK